MRHVVLGSNTTIGSSIVRLLASINADNILAVSPIGKLPDGVDPKRAEPVFGDITDLYTINNLFQEDDIIYYCQVVRDESANYEDAKLYNVDRFIDLLGFATVAEVNKIVCALPLALGYNLPNLVDEKTIGKSHSPIQNTLLRMREIIDYYQKGEEFGFKLSTLKELNRPPSLPTDTEYDGALDEKEESPGPSLKGSPSSGPSLKGSPSSGPSLKGSPSSGPSLKGSPSSGPSLKGSPSAGPVTGSNEDDVQDENQEDDSQQGDIDEEVTFDEENGDKMEEEPEEKPFEYEPISIVIGRIAKLFGPFEDHFTSYFCKSIRLQRIEVYGSIDKEISWINPIDAGRAMIILADENVGVNAGEYNIVGFNSSPLMLLQTLDEINHSNVELTQKGLFAKRIKHWFISVLRFLGIAIHDEYYEHLSLNRRQVFDDSKAREELDWEPKFGLKQTVKDAMTWFTSHKL